jgi:DNA-directed RNA polymerase subunit alpha
MEQVSQADPVAIAQRDSWSFADYRELMDQLLATNAPTKKMRAVLAELDSGVEPKGAEALKLGIANFIICRFGQALDALAKATDNKDRRWFAAQCYKNLRQYAKARDELALARDRGWDADQVAVEEIELLALDGDLDAAEKALAKYAKADSSQGHYVRGLIAELRGFYVQAAEAYETARDADPEHPIATFRLAYLADRYGNDEEAIDLYRECLAHPPVYSSALLNLAVLYEDHGENEKAVRCLDRLLNIEPDHPRARLFRRDVEASGSMYYDEDQARRIARRNAVLDIPVTDFELSVRARNCLKKMNIRSLGDLVRTSEPELLSYKNFGETSLKEIKDMLTAKGLRLGQALEEGADFGLEPQAEAEPTPSLGEQGVLGTPIEQVEFSIRARRALQNLGIRTLGELAARSETDLMSCRNFGQTSLNEVRQRLAEHSLSLRED